MQKLEVQLAYQDKPSYIRAIENADFFVTNDRNLALDASKFWEVKKQIQAYTLKNGCKYEPILSVSKEIVH